MDTTERGLHIKVSLINHSCVPNTMWRWVVGDFTRHQVKAIMAMEKDEEILPSYLDYEEFVFGSWKLGRLKLLSRVITGAGGSRGE